MRISHRIGGVVLAAIIAQGAFAQDNRIWTDQGWPDFSANAPDVWYNISQGSRLIRMDWFHALTQSSWMFDDRAIETDYGFPYLHDGADLPIGFVPDVDAAGTEWLGLNCSACHTSRLTFESQEVMIHGGQSYGDFRSLLGDLTKVVKETAADPAKAQTLFDTLPANGGYADIAALQTDLDDWLAHRAGIDRVQDGLAHNQGWGYGRADAVAYIQAATASVVENRTPDVVSTANAPVNYPPAWNANQQGALQHNGLVNNGTDLSLFDDNVKLGAYIRNWTEALGVFAQAEMTDNGDLTTSIIGPNLLVIEKALATLQSPKWPADVFGEIDPILAAQGADIYAENCVACHGIVEDTTDLDQLYPLDDQICSTGGSRYGADPFVCVQPVVDVSLTRAAQFAGLPPSKSLTGTDPMMTCNIMLHQMPTGKLEGQRKKNTFKSFDGLARFPERDFTNQVMAALIIKDLANQLPELVAAQVKAEISILISTIKSWFGINRQMAGRRTAKFASFAAPDPLADCAQQALIMNGFDPKNFPLPGYKARPLNGIWATPPYLHNGSVPTLYDLLLAPEDRPTSFRVPLGAFDPVNVGLAQDQGGFWFRTLDANGDSIVGNSNLGHQYGTSLSGTDRRALLAYLKGL